jgi:hypothetical protein
MAAKRIWADALPEVDEHSVEIEAGPKTVWRALVATVPPSRRGAWLLAALLGCREREASGDPAEPGSTMIGFRVARAEPPTELALAGEHRFSRYSLTFTTEDLGGGRSRLSAATRAAFPGMRGGAYRALVIGSGAHVRVVRAMLTRVKARAEAAA